MTSDALYSLARRDRLVLLFAAGLSKEPEKLVAGRAHASWREGPPGCGAKAPPFVAIHIGHLAHQESLFAFLAFSGQVLRSPHPPTLCVRSASASGQFGNRGDGGRGPVHGGSPILPLQNSQLPNDFNPVNHPFQLSEMTQNCLGANLLGAVSGLDQAAANGVAHQTRCFVDIKFLHESCSV
jgi:hypothetical protein